MLYFDEETPLRISHLDGDEEEKLKIFTLTKKSFNGFFGQFTGP